MSDRYSHVVLEVAVLICSVSPPFSAKKIAVCASTRPKDTRTAMQIAISSESNTWNTWFAGKGIWCGCPCIKQSCTRTSIHVIALACQACIVFPHRLRPTVWGEWRILWISCRIFTWFARAFLSSLNNNYPQRAYYRQEIIILLQISTLYGP